MRNRKLIKREKGAKSRWHTIEEFESALRLSCGFKSEAARILNISPASVTSRIDKSEHLQTVLDEVVTEQLDFAEKQLFEAIKDRESWAILFLLRCKGKSRGWQERQYLDVDVRPVGGVLVVPEQMSTDSWEAKAIAQQQKLLSGNNSYEDEEDEDSEE
jgi:hypothetical protein